MLFYGTVFVILWTAVPLKGLKSVTEAQQNVSAMAGDEVCLQCPLRYSEDVLQVMWQKVLPEEEVIMATCHSLRHKINPDFDGKIRLRDTRLQNCSIVVRNVTEQDEGCYLCLFITSTDVAFTGKTCLQMYELHDPNLTVSGSAGELVVSCSATGRPAPIVTLHVQDTGLTHNTVIVKNSNGTVTVTTTAVLSHTHTNTTQECVCAVRSPYEPERRVNTTIPGDAKHTVPNAYKQRLFVRVIIVLVCVGALIVIVTAAAVLLVKKQKHSDLEKNGNVGIQANHGTTPLRGSENQDESVRKRTPQSHQEGKSQRPLQSAKRLDMNSFTRSKSYAQANGQNAL